MKSWACILNHEALLGSVKPGKEGKEVDPDFLCANYLLISKG